MSQESNFKEHLIVENIVICRIRKVVQESEEGIDIEQKVTTNYVLQVVHNCKLGWKDV